MKKVSREIFKFSLTFIILVVSGYFLLVLAYALPTDRISDHVQESCVVFKKEDTYQQLIPGCDSTKLDNFTDALMLLSAENERTEKIWVEALNVSRLTNDEQNPAQILVSLHSGEELEYQTTSYDRYWHGYLIYLKPLLMVFNYQQIRYILFFLLMSLAFLLLYLIGKKNKKECFIPFLSTIFFLNPAVCALSLQYTPVFILTLAQVIVILLFEEKYKTCMKLWLYHFFVIGCLTVYFDLFTYPLVTFGIPIAFMVSQYTKNFKDGLKMLIGTGLLWGTGYGLMWASKWILASLITGNNTLTSAVNAMKFRTSNEYKDVAFNALDVIGKNFDMSKFSLIIIILLLAVCIIVGLIKNKKIKVSVRIIPMLCIAILPFIWYAVLSNHSWIHAWMTYRELAIFVYAITTVGMMFVCKEAPKVISSQN